MLCLARTMLLQDVCPPSVCPSVTRRYCVETTKHTVNLFHRYSRVLFPSLRTKTFHIVVQRSYHIATTSAVSLPSPRNLIISQLAETDRTVDRVGPNGPKSLFGQARCRGRRGDCRSLSDWTLLLSHAEVEPLETWRNNISRSFFQDICEPNSCL